MKRNIPFDQYQRYKHGQLIIDLIRKNKEQTLNILEVGANEHRNLESFLPNDTVTYLDIHVPDHLKEDSSFVEGDATSMPFAENEYDFIIALDVFEHIPNEKKKLFIDEINRVAKLGFLIAAPFDTKGVANSEVRLNEYYKVLYGEGYPWLEEHIELNLPSYNETEEYFKQKALNYFTFEHGSLVIWEKMMRIHFHVAGNSNLYNYRSTIDDFYLEEVFPNDYSRPCYRQFFVSINETSVLEDVKDRIMNISSKQINDEIKEKLNDLERSVYNIPQSNTEVIKLTKLFNEKENEIRNQIEEKRKLTNQLNNLQNQIKYIEEIAQSMRIKNRIKSLIKSVLPVPIIKKIKKKTKILMVVLSNPGLVKRAFLEIKKNGLNTTINKIKLRAKGENSVYSPPAIDVTNEMLAELDSFNYKPLISIIMPVYNVDPKWLKLAIQSVEEQIYTNWELCIVDDGSPNTQTRDFLNQINHEKIKIKLLNQNKGISNASNEAVSLSSGDYLALMDHDDYITKDALFEAVKTININNPDIIYSDEDKIDKNGKRKLPFFKPDWSPDLLRSQMYLGHLLVFKKKLFSQVGGFREGYEGSQDYDLLLRMTEITTRIQHIAKVLYSWRELETSTAINPDSKPYAQIAGLKALTGHLERKYGKGNAWAEETNNLFVYDVRYLLPDLKPLVSIIIPTKDHIELLDKCVRSMVKKTDYPNYEIIILNNNSTSEDSYKWFKAIEEEYKNIKIVNAFYDFNWSKLNNHGIKQASGEIYVFLNNDTVIISEDWLTRLSEKCLREDVGTVGGQLLYEDGSIQHAGVVVGMGGWADHVFKGMEPVHYSTPYVSPMVTRNVLASTGACLAISKNTIEKIGQFNEEFIICGSDIEISLRAYKQGLLNIYDPFVKLFHLESKTRSAYVPECDFTLSAIHYSPYRENGDPYYNQNLSLVHAIPTIR